MRTLIAMSLSCTVGFVAALTVVHLGSHIGGVAIAAVATCISVWGAVKAARSDRHERNRRYRDEVWQRRIREVHR